MGVTVPFGLRSSAPFLFALHTVVASLPDRSATCFTVTNSSAATVECEWSGNYRRPEAPVPRRGSTVRLRWSLSRSSSPQ
ncbi:hypothetical protein GCM10010339_48460 [Streptomyces alanosinicus]|uniref:Uncharacterized protein n=1 Tax=Streptomyces alanosinicus TaxID=68171 RepID=A0A918YKZ1_9ACTN|nr:hypothetical protein GCM10010339_48460 [Streptomyces alanosinicus]